MKRFTPDAIKNRMIERLRMNEDWALILQDGTIGNLIDTIAEGNAELARYEEYLLGEKKWKTAMNFTSLQHQSDLIGYKRTLPQSAIGYIVVSHTDYSEVPQNRLDNYGSYFFDIDAPSDWDDLAQKKNATLEERKALVPWTNSIPYSIPEGTRFTSTNGTEFISTKTVTSRILSEKWSDISKDEKKLQQFYEAGGWNGIKYCKVPVIQGKKKHVSIGTTNNTRFQTLVYTHTDIEAAMNSISEKYFKLILKNGDTEEAWVEINNIYRAGPYDKVFEKKILKDGTGIMIKFGDGISGQLPPNGYTVYIDYLETLGKSGNISAKYQIKDMAFPDGEMPLDPRTNTNRKFLYCTNTCAVLGGRDIESQDEFKKNAPASYLKSYTIGTADLYLDKIMKYSPISLLHCKIYPDKTITTRDVNGSLPNTVEQEHFNLISSNLQISAIKSNGDKVEADEADEAFIKPLLLSLSGQISPTDTFTYIEPNYIEFAPSFKIRTSSLSLNEDEAKGLISTIVSNEYDIFNQEFNEPLYTSKLIDLASNFSWADSVEVTNEALAHVNYDSEDLGFALNNGEPLVSIPFKFDNIFLKNLYKAGFDHSTYMLKIDVKFKNGKPAENDRTFILSQLAPSKDTNIRPTKNKIDTNGTIKVSIEGGPEVYYSSNTNIANENIVFELAQYKYINRITTKSYLGSIKDQKIENEDDIKKWTTIVYNIAEKSPVSKETSSGYLVFPFSYFNFGNDLNFNTYNEDKVNFKKVLEILLKEYVDIKVYAQPITEVFEPKNPNDICFIRKENIKVEKEIIY